MCAFRYLCAENNKDSGMATEGSSSEFAISFCPDE